MSQANLPSLLRPKRTQVVRAFGHWCEKNGYNVIPWWKQEPVAIDSSRPQRMVAPDGSKVVLAHMSSLGEKPVVEVLWSCGLRHSECVALTVADVNLVLTVMLTSLPYMETSPSRHIAGAGRDRNAQWHRIQFWRDGFRFTESPFSGEVGS